MTQVNSLDPEVQIKDTEHVIKNKLTKTLPELKGFKFVTTLVSVLKKIGSENKQLLL